MSLRVSFLIAFVYSAGLMLKKMGLSIGSMLLYVSVAIVFVMAIRYSLKDKSAIHILKLAGIFLIFLSSVGLIQYYFRADAADGWIAFAVLVISIFLFRTSKFLPTLVLIFLPLSVTLLAGFTDARTFHNIFHQIPYESFIRGKYTYTNRNWADQLIDRYKKPNAEKARMLIDQATAEASTNNNAFAAELFDSAIDFDPDNSVNYDKRGLFKLSVYGFEQANIYNALKDFERAIKLDSTNASALFHHAQCLAIMNVTERACMEYHKAVSIDSTVAFPDFENKYCKK